MPNMRNKNNNKRGRSSDTGRDEVLSRGLPGKHSEKELLKNVKKILKLFAAQGLLSYRRIHVMPIHIGPGRVRPNTDQQGMEDIQIYLFGGKTIYLELKSLKGKQSEHQKAREAELKSLGHDYWVCNSVDNFVAGLRQRGLSVWAYPTV